MHLQAILAIPCVLESKDVRDVLHLQEKGVPIEAKRWLEHLPPERRQSFTVMPKHDTAMTIEVSIAVSFSLKKNKLILYHERDANIDHLLWAGGRAGRLEGLHRCPLHPSRFVSLFFLLLSFFFFFSVLLSWLTSCVDTHQAGGLREASASPTELSSLEDIARQVPQAMLGQDHAWELFGCTEFVSCGRTKKKKKERKTKKKKEEERNGRKKAEKKKKKKEEKIKERKERKKGMMLKRYARGCIFSCFFLLSLFFFLKKK